MKSYFQLLIPTLLAVSAVMPATAVPAKPGIIKVKQADGTELPVQLRGDEHSHFYLSEDGYLLINDNDTYYYGNVDADGQPVRSDIRATAKAERTAEARNYLQQVDMSRVYSCMNTRMNHAVERAAESKATARMVRAASAGAGIGSPRKGPGLFSDTNFPAMGKQKAVVILVEYTDVKFKATYDAHDYFSRMLNEPGFSDYGGTGSAYDYFMESSMGQFEPQFDLFGPVTLSHPMSYYGGNDYWGDDKAPEQMVIEACQLLDATVDFSDYDRDGDGYIDNVFIFYAGKGEANGGSSNTVWPHSWNVTAATSTPYYFDGVRLDRYGCSNEWMDNRPDGVGTFVHEFSHVMGLPDLYSTNYSSAFTPGEWSVLDYGPYNNDGCTPPLYSAFERYALDWVEPVEINGPLNATLNPIGTNQCAIIRTSKSNEFFLLENRQKTSWDTYIPGHGMLVWHIDYNASVWAQNSVNNSSSHQYVDLEEADGTKNDMSRAGDAFPGTSHTTSFTDTTSPSMKTWSGQSLGLPITEIAENDGIITFKVCGGREPLQPTVALDATYIDSYSFTANWQSAGDDAAYILSVYTLDENGKKLPLKGYGSLNIYNETSYSVYGTEPDTDYYYTVSVGGGLEVSEPSNVITVHTGEQTIEYLTAVAQAASDVTHEGFTANWESLDAAESYLLTVYTKEYGAPVEDVCDFTDGVTSLPSGWTSTSEASYANSAYSGAAIPSLRLSTSADVLTSPEYPAGIRTFAMWHRGNSTSEGDMVVIDGLVSGQWSNITSVPVVKTTGGELTSLTDIPTGTTRIRVSYSRTGERGALAVDDVTIGHNDSSVNVPLAGYTDLNVGNVTDYQVGGLAESTPYFYTVKAVDAEGRQSKPSQEIAVTTGADPGNSGVAAVTQNTATVTVEGRNVTLGGAEAGSRFAVCDTMGRTVAAAITDASGTATVSLTAAGVYIAVTDHTHIKFIIK